MTHLLKKITVIIALCLLIPLDVSRGAILLDRVVAIVDREIITWSELYRAMTIEYQPLMEGMNKDDKKTYLERVQHEFIDKLINMKLQTEAAKRAGFSVTEEELSAAIRDIRKQYNFTLQEFKKALEKDGIRYGEYKSMLKDQILISKIVASEVRGKVIVTDEEITDYIEKNRADLPLELSFKLFEVHIKEDGLGDREIKNITEEIYSRIRSGKKLEEFIKDFNEAYPGKIEYKSGFIHASELRKDFFEALKDLNKGQVTKPIHIKKDVYILKIQDKESPVELDVMKRNIRELVLNIKSSDLHKSWIKKLRQSAFIEIKL